MLSVQHRGQEQSCLSGSELSNATSQQCGREPSENDSSYFGSFLTVMIESDWVVCFFVIELHELLVNFGD